MAELTSVAAVVLAAGFSRRLGRPKQTAKLAGETLVERGARMAREAGLEPVLIITNSELAGDPAFPQEQLRASGCAVVVNRDAAEGMASSIRCGVCALDGQGVSGVVLMTCDQVAVTSAHLRSLIAEPEETCGSGYAGKVGVPAYFPSTSFEDLTSLRGDQGARELLRGVRVVTAEELALDVDSGEDLRQAEEWFAKARR